MAQIYEFEDPPDELEPEDLLGVLEDQGIPANYVLKNSAKRLQVSTNDPLSPAQIAALEALIQGSEWKPKTERIRERVAATQAAVSLVADPTVKAALVELVKLVRACR